MKRIMALASVVLLCCLAAVQADTTGQRYYGYTMVSDVTGYLNMTMDACDIQAALKAGNWTAVQSIYTSGKNSKRGAGMRSFGGNWAAPNHTGQANYDAFVAYHKDAGFLNSSVYAAIAQKNAAAVTGLMDSITIKYMLHEIDEGSEKVEDKDTAPATGAPHNLDEGWGMWAASGKPMCGMTPAERANRLASEMGISYMGMSPTNTMMAWLYNDLLFAATKNDSASYDASAKTLKKVVTGYLIQSLWRDTYCAALATSCANVAVANNCKAGAVATWHVLAPLIPASQKANHDILKSAVPMGDYAKAKPAVAAIMAAEGISGLGSPKEAAIKATVGLAACVKSLLP